MASAVVLLTSSAAFCAPEILPDNPSAEKFIKIYPENLESGLLYISPDISSSIGWGMTHNFPGWNQGHQSHVDMPIKIIVDVPENIEVAGAKKVGTVEHDGKTYIRYVEAGSRIYNRKYYGRFLRSNLVTKDKSGKGSIYYHVKWAGGAQPLQKLDFEIIRVPRATPPKRFLVGMYNFSPKSVEEAMRMRGEMALNTLSLYGQDVPLVKDLIKAGFFVRRGDYFFPGWDKTHPFLGKIQMTDTWKLWVEEDHDSRALDINGQPIPIFRNGDTFMLSPSYRGKFFDEAIAREIAYVQQTGVSWFAFDMEDYIIKKGEAGCFHPRTIEAFKKYLSEKHPGTPFMDPREFEKVPENYPDYHVLWVDFKCWLWADFFEEMKRRLAPHVAQTSPKKGVVFSEWGLRVSPDVEKRNNIWHGKEWLQTFDYTEIDSYASVEHFVRYTEERIEGLKRFAPEVEPGFLFCISPSRIDTMEFYRARSEGHPPLVDEVKYKLFEAAAFGLEGAFYWNERYRGVWADKCWNEALAAIGKVEDIVVDGKRTGPLTTDTPKVRAHGVALADRAVVAVSEYIDLKPVTAKVSCPVKKPSMVTDAETGEALGEISPGQPEFPVTLDKSRCRLLLIQPQAESP